MKSKLIATLDPMFDFEAVKGTWTWQYETGIKV